MDAMNTTKTIYTIEKGAEASSILRLATAYASSRILHSAVQVGVFEALRDTPADLTTLCASLGLHPRLSRDFLEALVALGLLEKDGDRYQTSEASRKFLLPDQPAYLGGRIKIGAERHYRAWLSLTDALRDGEPKADIVPDAEAYKILYGNPEKAREFLSHMDAGNVTVASQLDECIDWSKYRTFVDVGGARGQVAGTLASRHPHLTGGVFDFPTVRPFFDELMARLDTESQVDFHPGDFFVDPIPSADVFIIGHVLHDWSVSERRRIVARIYEAARAGSMVLVYDQMLDDHRPALQGLITSLNVALMTPGGSEYTVADCRGWMEDAGFQFCSARRLPVGNDTVLLAERTG